MTITTAFDVEEMVYTILNNEIVNLAVDSIRGSFGTADGSLTCAVQYAFVDAFGNYQWKDETDISLDPDDFIPA
jgi:hypothetical protein